MRSSRENDGGRSRASLGARGVSLTCAVLSRVSASLARASASSSCVRSVSISVSAAVAERPESSDDS